MEDKIKKFLGDFDVRDYGGGTGAGTGEDSYPLGKGFGCRNGCGSNGHDSTIGYGCGEGRGQGSGYDDGRGYGDYFHDNKTGSVSEFGPFNEMGLKKYDNHDVYLISGLPMIIYSVYENYAKGAIIDNDLRLRPCFIAKFAGYLDYGETLEEAQQDVHEKAANIALLSDNIFSELDE